MTVRAFLFEEESGLGVHRDGCLGARFLLAECLAHLANGSVYNLTDSLVTHSERVFKFVEVILICQLVEWTDCGIIANDLGISRHRVIRDGHIGAKPDAGEPGKLALGNTETSDNISFVSLVSHRRHLDCNRSQPSFLSQSVSHSSPVFGSISILSTWVVP